MFFWQKNKTRFKKGLKGAAPAAPSPFLQQLGLASGLCFPPCCWYIWLQSPNLPSLVPG